VGKWTLVVALCGAACAKGVAEDKQSGVVTPPGGGTGTDAGTPPDAGPGDAGGPDAGPVDAGHAGVTPVFGTPGPWPMANVTYGSADGIQESPVVGVSTDEPVKQADGTITQNLWVATNQALYLLRPGDKQFTRFDGNDGLHLPGFVAAMCHERSGSDSKPCPNGDAAAPGISEIVGGGSGDGYLGEVFVGYYAFHTWDLNDGTDLDPWRHNGKLDRVRIKADPSGKTVLDTNGKLQIEVIRFDMVSNNTAAFWHNKTVYKMVYDHGPWPDGPRPGFVNKHELYVGCDHGVTKISPDMWKESVGWFLAEGNQQVWMSDHLHPRACLHQHCNGDSNLMLADWRGLGIDAQGDLWVGGRYAASRIRYVADNRIWWQTPRPDGSIANDPSFGDPYDGNCSGNRPVFCTPMEGDKVNISAVAPAPDGRVWFSSGILFNEAGDVNYGIAVWQPHGPFTYYDPVNDAGMAEANVRDKLVLPDGRLVLAGPNSGLTFWDPATGKHASIRAGQGIPDDRVLRIQLDAMVDPPALHVATRGGATVLRVLP
jgi:hypothetical protein